MALLDGITSHLDTNVIIGALSVPGVHGTIVGSHSPEQIAGTVGAVDVELTAADLAQIETGMQRAVPLIGPSPEAKPTEPAT